MLLVVGPASLVSDHFMHLRINRFFNLLHLLQAKRLIEVDDLRAVVFIGCFRYSKVLPLLVEWPADFFSRKSLLL